MLPEGLSPVRTRRIPRCCDVSAAAYLDLEHAEAETRVFGMVTDLIVEP